MNQPVLTRTSNPSRLAPALLTALAIGVAGAMGAGGCSDGGDFKLTGGGNEGGSSSNNGGSGGGGGVFVDNGAELFTGLEQELVDNCALCHEPGGIGDAPFLAPPDRYASILAWPGIVVKNPEESLFLTYAISGSGHQGTQIDSVPGLEDKVREWLEAEAGAISDPVEEDVPHIDPVTPILGFNAIYLTPLDEELTGVAITFTAEQLTETSLKLSDIEVHTTSQTGIHIVHPVFAVYPKGKPGEADPVDSFATLDERYAETVSAPLGVGLLILTNWEKDAKLGIGFEVAEPYTVGGGEGGAGAGGGGTEGGCNALTEFDASAKPQFQMRCAGCHGGADPQATGAMDMSDLANNSGAACGQIKNRINTANPAQSQIFITTDPQGNAAHPFKFGGNAAQFNTFRDQVSIWVEAE